MKNQTTIRHSRVSSLLLAILLVALAAPQLVFAEAATFTQTIQNEPFPIIDPLNPCSPGIGSGIVNGVVHFTEVENGSIHMAITITGSFEVIDLNSGQNATGHFTFREGQNLNLAGQIKNSQTFILSVNGKLEDGTNFHFNLVGQLREVDGVPTLDFFNANCH